MQKYFYRNVVVLAAIAILFSISLNARTTPEEAAVILKKELSLTTPKNISAESQDFLKDLDKASKESFLNYGAKIANADISNLIKENDNNSTKNTIFYMYSDSVPFVAIENLIPQINKFKKHNPSTQFFIVFNGFPKKEFMNRLRKKYKDEYKNIFSIKVHPYIYRYFDLKMVPAYIFNRCNLGDNFRFKKCKNDEAILAKGDMALVDFFNILSENDKKYLKYYNQMIEAE